MAAPRQARKSVFWPGTAGFGVTIALMALCPILPIRAATTEYVVVDRITGLAIYGYDPVAYFVGGAPAMGKGEFDHPYAGAVWQFRNPGNLAAFAADPDVYMPRFGGYDPIGIGRGATLAGDPNIWLIAGQRLFLFHSAENRAAFAAASATAVAVAEEAWPTVRRTLSP